MRTKKQNNQTCAPTKEAKQPAAGKPVKHSQTLTVHTDVCGPFKQGTFGRKQLSRSFTLTPHRYKSFKFVRSRDAVPDHCYNFAFWLDINTIQDVRRVHNDNASEFVGMNKICKKKRLNLAYLHNTVHSETV